MNQLSTNQSKIVTLLQKHPKGLTDAQLRRMYGIGSPSKEVFRLRSNGVPVFTVTETKRGRQTNRYALRAATPDMIATAHFWNGAEAFKLNLDDVKVAH